MWKSVKSSWKTINSHKDVDDWDDWDDWDDDEDWEDEPTFPVVPSPTVVNPSGYNEKDDPLIAFVNASTLLSDKEVEIIQKACQKQVDEDYGPFWHIGMRSVFVPKGQAAPLQAWSIFFLDKPTISGALGYHDFINGQPVAYVFISTSKQANVSPSSVASHEALEMLSDPLINTTAQVGNQTFYAYESCDAVQQSSYTVGVELDGVTYPVEMSNFVTPDWFRTETNGPWDFLRKLNGPLELLPNGSYIGMWTPKTGWVQKNAFGQIEPLEEDDKRYIGDGEKATTIYHAPQEPQRCLRPFQRRQMDKPLEVTSAWRMVAIDEQSSKLWLDDIREAPEGWHHAKTADEAIKALEGGRYSEISLNHDLGPEEAGTGYDVVKYLEEQFHTNPDFVMPKWAVHSANPVGRERMEQVLRQLTNNSKLAQNKKHVSWKTVSKIPAREITLEESEKSYDFLKKTREDIAQERQRVYKAEDSAEDEIDPQSFYDSSHAIEDLPEIITSIQKQQWFKDAFHPVFHNLPIKIERSISEKKDPDILGEAKTRYKKLKDLSEAPLYDPNKEILRSSYPLLPKAVRRFIPYPVRNLLNPAIKLFDKKRFQMDEEGQRTVINPVSEATIKLPQNDARVTHYTFNHELAHVLNPGAGHNSDFRGTHLFLTQQMHGQEAFERIRKHYLDQGLHSTFGSMRIDKLHPDFVKTLQDDAKTIQDRSVKLETKVAWKSIHSFRKTIDTTEDKADSGELIIPVKFPKVPEFARRILEHSITPDFVPSALRAIHEPDMDIKTVTTKKWKSKNHNWKRTKRKPTR